MVPIHKIHTSIQITLIEILLAFVPLGGLDCLCRSTLADRLRLLQGGRLVRPCLLDRIRIKLGRSCALAAAGSTLADQVYFGRSGPRWPIRSTLDDQVHCGHSGPLWSIKPTLADQVHFGRSIPRWPIKSTLADQVHFV